MSESDQDRKQLREIVAELQGSRNRLFEMLKPRATAREGDEPTPLQLVLWKSIRDLDAVTEYLGGTAAEALDLTRNDEEMRELLYDLVVEDCFSPQALDDPGDVFIPPYSPEQAGLKVYFEHGRWFATWLKLEEPEDRPASERHELLLLEQDKDCPGLLHYVEV